MTYHLKCAFQNIWINRSSAFLTLLTTTLTLMLFAIFLLFYHNSRNFVTSVQEDVEISVYLRDGITGGNRRAIEKTLKSDPRIASFRYVSKDDALLLFQEKFSGESLLAHLGGNPLPASFEVYVATVHQKPGDMAEIAGQMRKLAGVEDVQYGVEWLKNFSDFLAVIKFLGLGLGAGLAVAVVTIIAHAIRLHFYDRSEEVEIMKLIGATPRFIKNPFLLEGVVIGAAGGVLSCTAIWGLFRYVDLHLAELGGIVGKLLRLHFLPPYMIAGIVATGALLGGLGGELSLAYLLRFRAKTIPKSRLRAGLFVVLISLTVLGGVPTSWGKDDAAVINARKKELTRVQEEIKQKKAEAQNLKNKEASILATLEDIDRHIQTNQKEAQSLELKIKRKEGEQEYVSEALRELEKSLEERRAQVAQRVRLLYREGAEGVITVLVPSPDYPLFLKRLHYLKVIAEKEAEMVSVLEEEQAQWEAKNNQLGNITRKLVETHAPLVARLDKIETERAKKKVILDRIQDEKAYYKEVIPELDKASSELKALIKKLEEERRRREALEAAKHKIPAPVFPPVGNFGAIKGRLPWPNAGEVTSFFGRQKHMRFNTYIFKKGIEIETSQQDAVRAVHEGTVVYADWFKGYGMIIILDHGEDYYSVYGYLSRLFVAVGQKIEQNRLLGAVGNTGLSDGKHLYFELRHQGEPMDPLAWLQKRSGS